jgi:hypothetical protein
MDTLDTLIAARVGKPSGIVTGEVPVWNGSTWVRSSATQIGLNSLTDPGSGKVIGSLGAGAVAVQPPGTTLAYVEFTASVSANTVAEAAATLVVSAGAVTFDGTAVDIEFFSPGYVHGGSSATHGINLWDVATDLGRLYDGTVVASTSDQLGALKRRLTPSAGSHTYNIRIWESSATNFVALAGAGGAGTKLPGYIKITKA